MAQVTFTANLRRHVDCAAAEVAAGTVREALDGVFARNPLLRSYLLDDQARLRRHVVVYVDDVAVTDRVGLGDPAVGPDSRIFVFQMLTGG